MPEMSSKWRYVKVLHSQWSSLSGDLSVLRLCSGKYYVLCIAVGDIRYKNFFRGAVVVFHLHCQRCEHDSQWQTLGNDQHEARAIIHTVLGTVLYTGSQYSKVKT